MYKQLLKLQLPRHCAEAAAGADAGKLEILKNSYQNLHNMKKLYFKMIIYSKRYIYCVFAFYNYFVVVENAPKGSRLPEVQTTIS